MIPRLYCSFICTVLISSLGSHLSYAQDVWKFSVLVCVEKQTADYYEKAYSKSINLIVREQIATINSNFNSSRKFKGVFNFRVDSVYTFTGEAKNEIFKPHPKHDYKVVINGFSDDLSGGGWYGSNRTIYHNWKWNNSNGPFGQDATDGTTHEFGHSRGAIDIYGLKVDAQKNTISNTGFEPINSIMNYPYGNIVWDEYSVNLINSTSSFAINNEKYITTAFPNVLKLKTVDLQGIPLKNVSIEVYPVDWFSYEVKSGPLLRVSTNLDGIYQFLSNPYQPDVSGYPWNIRYCNFLIKATYNSNIVYKWMPLYEVQNAYFKSGASSIYNNEIQFPTSTAITLSSISSVSVCPGVAIKAIFTSSGSFDQDNRFTLQLSDVSGSFSNPVNIGDLAGNQISAINGLIPYGTLAGNRYKVRVVSSKPYAQSNEQVITEVKASSPTPTASTVSYCVGQQASALSAGAASGGALLWYSAASGNTLLQTAPTPPTSNPANLIYYVSQTVGTSCESQCVPLTVTINSIPAAPTLSQTAISACQSTQAASLTATGQNLKWYEVASGGTGVPTLRPNTDNIGTKAYYVSQTISACEGPRSSVAIVVNGKPGAPPVDSVQTICQTTKAAFFESSAVAVKVKTDAFASALLYSLDGNPAGGYSANTRFENTTSFYFRLGSLGYSDTPTYPVAERKFYATQAVNGCQSDKVTVTLRTLYWPTNGPTPTNQFAPMYGALNYCQGDRALSLKENGHSPALTSYNVVYKTEGTSSFSAIAPTPSTDKPGVTTYALQYVTTDPGKYCNPQITPFSPNVETYLKVTINSRPNKPSVSTAASSKTYCQNQSADVLSANADANANLIWYGTDATGGKASAIAPKPATDKSGTFKYYVAQSLNGCEGERSEIVIVIKPAPNAPAATNNALTYCQNQPATVLSAAGNQLRWTFDNKSGDFAPTPQTQTVGTASYFVTQTVDGCESGQTEVKVVTKATPGVPGTSAVSVCQNEPSRTLTADGQSLKWYTASTGGDGIGTAPTIKTDQATQANYYVSQSIESCEGPRATLTVTVRQQPNAPGVTKADICQFTKATPVTATGSNPTWYDADGKNVGSNAPTPSTDKGATFTYQVTQTVDGCVSARASLVVMVQTTPLPILTKAQLELCKDSKAAPLEAKGDNLKWTDPTGTTSTTAPIPYTTETTKNPDGDPYYVTQTGSNGCESSRAVIRVFVQGPPTLALSGSTPSVNLGIDVPITLKFTGVGPYQYKILTGIGQPISGSAIKDTIIRVLPERTTIYQVAEVSNRCGMGLPVSTATVVVLVPIIQTQALVSGIVCAGGTLTTSFLQTGQFNTGSVFRLQFARAVADSTKIQYNDLLNSQITGGQISATIPATATAGTYLVRVVATNPKIPVNGTVSPTLLTIQPLPTATLTATPTSVYEGETVKLSIAFTGNGPWKFAYRDSSSVGNTGTEIMTLANPHVIELKPQKPSVYRLVSLSNGCGQAASLPTAVAVTVNSLLAIEPLASQVQVFPVPVRTTLTVQIDPSVLTSKATLTLTDERGVEVIRQETHQKTTLIQLDKQPAGIYILQVSVGQQKTSHRLLKL